MDSKLPRWKMEKRQQAKKEKRKCKGTFTSLPFDSDKMQLSSMLPKNRKFRHLKNTTINHLLFCSNHQFILRISHYPASCLFANSIVYLEQNVVWCLRIADFLPFMTQKCHVLLHYWEGNTFWPGVHIYTYFYTFLVRHSLYGYRCLAFHIMHTVLL